MAKQSTSGLKVIQSTNTCSLLFFNRSLSRDKISSQSDPRDFPGFSNVPPLQKKSTTLRTHVFQGERLRYRVKNSTNINRFVRRVKIRFSLIGRSLGRLTTKMFNRGE